MELVVVEERFCFSVLSPVILFAVVMLLIRPKERKKENI